MRIFFTLFLIALILNCKLSAQNQLIIQSKYLEKPDTIWIFTPKNYSESTENLSLVFLLHGWSGNYHQWNDIMNCQQYANEFEIIIVCPDGLYDSWYINSPAKEKSQFASFFMDDLVPEIFSKYRIDQQNIFITGLSMGGHGALYLFTQHPDFFKSAGSISGVLDLNLSSDKKNLNALLGVTENEQNKELFLHYSVFGNIDVIAKAGKEIIFSCGNEDKYYHVNNTFRDQCDEMKIKATYISSPGGHNYPYWKNAIRYHIVFFHQLTK